MSENPGFGVLRNSERNGLLGKQLGILFTGAAGCICLVTPVYCIRVISGCYLMLFGFFRILIERQHHGKVA